MKSRYRKLATGGAVLAEAPPIPEAPLVTAAPIPDPVIEPELVQEDDDLAQSGLPDSAQKWLRSRPEFLYDPDASAKLAALHWKVVDDDGLEPYSEPYFRRIEQRLEQPTVSGDDIDQQAVDKVLAEAKRHMAPRPKAQDEPDNSFESNRRIYSAPPSRQVPNSNGTRAYLDDPRSVVLTREQKEAARFSGISEAEYARQVLELNRRKSLGDFTGQP